MTALSTIRQIWSSIFGTQFGGARDLYAIFGYTKIPTYKDFYFKFTRQDIAYRIVTAPVKSMWRKPPIVVDKDGGAGAFALAWNEFVRENKVYHYLQRLDVLAGLGTYSILYLGLPGEPNQPVNATDGQKLMYLQPYSVYSAAIKKYDINPKSPRFARPELYQIQIRDVMNQQANVSSPATGVIAPPLPFAQPVEVHWSRVLHICEDPLENEVFGLPRLQKVYNLLEDLIKVVGGSAETFWLTSNRGMQVDVDKDMDLGSEDATALKDEVNDYINQLARIIKTRGVKITPLGEKVADPKGAFEVIVAMISGATGIPNRILIGAEAGQLASQEDRANWANRCEERANDYGEPLVLRPFVQKCIDLKLLPAPNGEVQVSWPSFYAPSPFETSQTMAQKARAAVNLQKALQPIAEDPTTQAQFEVDQEAAASAAQAQQPGFGSGAGTQAAKGDAPASATSTTPAVPKVAVPPMRYLITIDEARGFLGLGPQDANLSNTQGKPVVPQPSTPTDSVAPTEQLPDPNPADNVR